jgi:cbb3-type cytochrome oxidase maturation protein
MVAAFVFLWLFVWNVRSGQYEDSYTPSVRILFDDEPAEAKNDELKGKDDGDLFEAKT